MSRCFEVLVFDNFCSAWSTFAGLYQYLALVALHYPYMTIVQSFHNPWPQAFGNGNYVTVEKQVAACCEGTFHCIVWLDTVWHFGCIFWTAITHKMHHYLHCLLCVLFNLIHLNMTSAMLPVSSDSSIVSRYIALQKVILGVCQTTCSLPGTYSALALNFIILRRNCQCDTVSVMSVLVVPMVGHLFG